MVSLAERRAHQLACEIEEIHAKERARMPSRFKYPKSWQSFYDPHAATELGNLIYNRMCPRKKKETV